MNKPVWMLLAAGIALAACSKSAAPKPAVDASQAAGIDLTAMDTQANPCQDFYQYACGNWNAHNPIPNDQVVWGKSSLLAQKNQDTLHTILTKASEDSGSEDAVSRQVGDYYAACMDESAINRAGITPVQPELDRIAAIGSRQQLANEVARLQLEGVDAVFSFGSDQDFKHATSEIADADQGGLGLPDRDYYTKTDAQSVKLRQQYQAHVAKMMELLGEPAAQAAGDAATVMAIETALARASMTNVARRDPDATYHKMSLGQLEALSPNFDWAEFLRASQAPAFSTLNVVVPGFFRSLNAELQAAPLAQWKTYLRWHLIHTAAPSLSQPIDDANFAFFGQTLTGQKVQKDRWKRCVASTDRNLGEALGQLYVKVAFSPEAKAHMQALVGHLETALGQDIQGLNWMTTATKQQAMLKLHAIMNKVAYPDTWRDYSSVQITRDNYYQDLKNAVEFESHRELGKIGKPVDRSEWTMTPPTVNAYYNPLLNEIVFPAGILQPPFYDPNRNDAANYGGVGLVMGHELTHGFDDQGSQFDPQGNLRNWWTPADAKAFKERTACIVKEYSGFSPLPGVHLNGELTLGENTADNGGARVAYMAMEDALGDQPDVKLDGFDRAQRFFLGYGQLWCQNERPEVARLRVNTDPHSPGKFRVNGVVQNMAEFAAAFHCGPTDPMTAGPKSCRVW